MRGRVPFAFLAVMSLRACDQNMECSQTAEEYCPDPSAHWDCTRNGSPPPGGPCSVDRSACGRYDVMHINCEMGHQSFSFYDKATGVLVGGFGCDHDRDPGPGKVLNCLCGWVPWKDSKPLCACRLSTPSPLREIALLLENGLERPAEQSGSWPRVVRFDERDQGHTRMLPSPNGI
jgi:hypothetical protein